MKEKCTSHEKPLAIFHAWVYGPQAALIAERFGTRSRYSGASLGYQLENTSHVTLLASPPACPDCQAGGPY
jgi:hypothetical protein